MGEGKQGTPSFLTTGFPRSHPCHLGKFICMYMYACVYLFRHIMCTNIHICVYVYMYICLYVCVYICARMSRVYISYMCVYMFTYTYMCAYAYVCSHVHMHVYVCICVCFVSERPVRCKVSASRVTGVTL